MEVSLREFQLHANKYLKELDRVKYIFLTRYGYPIAKIVPFISEKKND